MRIVVGSDHAGVVLKATVCEVLRGLDAVTVADVGVHSHAVSVDYPDIAVEVARVLQQEQADRGILILSLIHI